MRFKDYAFGMRIAGDIEREKGVLDDWFGVGDTAMVRLFIYYLFHLLFF